jgi:hypothetical protein
MRDCLLTLLYLTVMVAKLRGPGGTRAVIAECLDRIVPLGESHLRTAVRASWITIRGTTAPGFLSVRKSWRTLGDGGTLTVCARAVAECIRHPV